MKKIDKDGLLLCNLQAEAFEQSIGYINSRQFFSIELFSIIMLTNCDFFTNQAKKNRILFNPII